MMTYLKPALAAMALGAGPALFGAPLALAQEAQAPATHVEKFVAMDVDSNGLVSEPEFVAYAAEAHDASEEDAKAKFAQIAGEDGQMTLAEFEAVHSAHHQKEASAGS